MQMTIMNKNKNSNGLGSWSQSIVRGKTRYRWTIVIDGKSKSLSSYNMDDLKLRVQAYLDNTKPFKYDPIMDDFDKFASIFLDKGTSSVKQKTRDNYTWTYTHYVKGTFLGHSHLNDITPLQLDIFFDDLTNKSKLSAATVQTVRRVIRLILNYAIRQGYILTNPVQFAKGPRLKPRKVDPLTDAQIILILKIAHSEAYDSKYSPNTPAHVFLKKCFRYSLLLTIYSGLRWAETFGLTWDKIDYDNNRINIDQSMADNSKGKYIDDPKSTDRYVPIPPFVIAELIKWHEQLDNYKTLMGNLYDDTHNLVFPNSTGGFMHRSNFRRRFWLPLKQAVNIPLDYHWHDLRHSYASLLSHKGISPADLAATLGHSTDYISNKYYNHAMRGFENEVINTLEPYGDILKEVLKDE